MSKYKEIREPEDLKNTIDDAFRKAQKEGRNMNKNTIKKVGVAAVITLGVFTVGMNTSPTFAAGVDRIPFINKIAQFFKFDKGLEEAGKNGFIQIIDKSCVIEGTDVTVESAVYDQNRLVVKISYSNKEKLEDISLVNAKLKYQNGESVEEYSMSVETLKEVEGRKVSLLDIRIDNVDFKEENIIIMPILAQENGDNLKMIDSEEGVQLKLDKELFNSIPYKYMINEKLEKEGVKININDLTVHPTEMRLEIDVLENGEEFSFDGFAQSYVKDGEGNEYATFGASDIQKDGDRVVLYESNYFRENKDMELKIEGLYLNRNKEYHMNINSETETLKSDCDYNVDLYFINKNENGEVEKFGIKIDDERLINENINKFPVGEIKEIKIGGKSFDSQESQTSWSYLGKDTAYIIVELKEAAKGDVSFKLYDLTEYRELNETIKIEQ